MAIIDSFTAKLDYEQRHISRQGARRINSGDKWFVGGTDNFDYEDYPVALCDHAEEVEHVVAQREKDAAAQGSLPDSTWIIPPVHATVKP